MRSLAFKWIATLLLTSLLGVALVGVFAYNTTVTEFDRLRVDQAAAEFANTLAAYYREHGSWDGFADAVSSNLPPPVLPLGPLDPAGVIAVVDVNGNVLLGSGRYDTGDHVLAQDLANGTPIIVDGQPVGTALLALPPPQLDPRERRYIESTNRALLIGAVGAAGAAMLVGVVLSRGFLRQLGELTRAMGAMRQGELDQQVQVYSRDELGQVARAFNQMSADLHRSNDLREQMTADIAHELRTPLTVISGYVEGLTDGTFKPNQARFEAIGTEVALLRRLVDDLRTLSLADAGELRLAKADEHPADLLASIHQSFEPLADKQGIRLHMAAAADLPQVPLDRERILQVLANLTSNALRHTPRGGTVTLGASVERGMMELGVGDTGTGIAAEHLPNIFERFYRADPARDSDSGESGLGLAIARSIVEAHGGTIAAASAAGQGTTITLRLPLSPGSATAPATRT